MRMLFRAMLVALAAAAPAALADVDAGTRRLALDIFKELVEINTTESAGSVTRAAETLARRLRAAGFDDADIALVGPVERKKNLVVRLRGSGSARPVLLLGHLDVVEADRKDWDTDPFQFVEKDGYYYGRGTQDMKDGDAIMVTTLIRLKREGYRPPRDVILALTADEETGDANGVEWLMNHRRDLVDAEFALNHDDICVHSSGGKPLYMQLVASEKVYADFELTVRNKGGHSSEPAADNAIYELAGALQRLAGYRFPFELNDVTRAYYARMAARATGARAADLKAILAVPPDPAAVERLTADPIDNSLTRTTCVATRLSAGQANNALPQKAQAVVNCRILPGHEPEDVRRELVRVLAEPKLAVRLVTASGASFDAAESLHAYTAPPLRADVLGAAETAAAVLWPGMPVIPWMSAGATDAAYAIAAGIPVFVVSGTAVDESDRRQHANDERLGVEAFYRSLDFYYLFLKALLASH